MKPIMDVDGTELPPPEPSSDLAAFERLTMFCRRNNIRLGPMVRVGSIVVTMEDRDLPTKTENPPDFDALVAQWIKSPDHET